MADLSQLLAQLLGQREQEQPNLNPQAPSTIPGTRGLFARRPVTMPRNMGMLDVQPVPIEQALDRQSARIFPDRAGMGVRGWQQGQDGSWSMEPVNPPAPRQRPVSQTNPGAYANFAEYANASTGGVGLGGSSAVVEQPRNPPTPWDQGVRRGMEPPDAEFALDPAYVQFRGPVNYGGEYPYRNVNNGTDPNTGQRIIVGERLGPVRDRLSGEIVTKDSRFAAPDAPERHRRPIERPTPAAPYSLEDEAWAAAQERSRAARADRPGMAMGDLVGRLDRRGRPNLVSRRDRRLPAR